MLHNGKQSHFAANKTLEALCRRFPDLYLRHACDVPALGRMSTGLPALDGILGGGWPRGRIVHLYGREATGKSDVGLKFLKECQRQGHKAILVDSDHSFDRSYTAEIGVTLADLIVCRPPTIEEAFQTCSDLLRAMPIEGIVFDSIASLPSRYDLNSDFAQGVESGHQAAFLSRALPRLLQSISSTGATVLVINQMRDAVQRLFGKSDKPTSGRALRHYASIGAEIRRLGLIEQDGVIIGSRNSVTIVTSKVCSAYRVAEFELMYVNTVPRRADVIETRKVDS